MLYQWIIRPDAPALRIAWLGTDRSATWGELGHLARERVGRLEALARQRVGVVVEVAADCLATVSALDKLDCDVFLLDGQAGREAQYALAAQLRLAALVRRGTAASDIEGGVSVEALADALPGSGQSTLTILTSGTSDKPKAVRHTWASLSRPVRKTVRAEGPVWLLSYRLHLYAGLQVVLQCLLNGGTLVIPAAGAPADDVARLLVTARVEFASATPSYWRRLLLFADPGTLRQASLQQITIGGEAVDQQVLNLLHQQFPGVRLVHIYATSELGRCFSVADGKAGFPACFLDQPSADGVELKIEAGELWVRSMNAMSGYDPLLSPSQVSLTSWFATGDLVERRGDRIYFLGRRTDIINVGGQKVHPLEVESVIRAGADVMDARVFPHPSSIVGQVVACEVVGRPGSDPQTVELGVRRRCLANLNAHQRPRLISIVRRIETSAADKVVRRQNS